MRRPLGISVVLAGAACAAILFLAAAPPASVAAPVTAVDTFLGWEIGEERRYTIGPDEALRPGEEIIWSVRLDRVEAGDGVPVGVFDMAHKHERYGISIRGKIDVIFNYTGEVRINQYGFPERVSISIIEEHTGESPFRGEVVTARYTFDGKQYIKDVSTYADQWQFQVPIANHGPLDLDLPAGLFLFRPQAAGTDFFTNPAMLGFAIPDVLPEDWEQRTLFFRPTYPVRYPGAGYARNERDRQAALGRYWVKQTLSAGEQMELEIGGRTLNVTKVRISGAMRDAYVDDAGRVVRIDLDPDQYTRHSRFVRLLFPSEY